VVGSKSIIKKWMLHSGGIIFPEEGKKRYAIMLASIF